MRRYFFEILAVALIGGSLFFFKETLDYLARRDYVAALLVMVIGVAVISVRKEMARLVPHAVRGCVRWNVLGPVARAGAIRDLGDRAAREHHGPRGRARRWEAR